MNRNNYFISLLAKASVIKYGHFIATSKKHLDTYVTKDAIIRDPTACSIICSELVRIIKMKIANYKETDFITGPAIAGAIFSGIVANSLDKGFVYPEKKFVVQPEGHTAEEMVFSRGHDLALKKKSVIIIEDIVTTGGSINKTISAVEKNGGIVIGVVVIWNRSDFSLGHLPVHSIIDKKLNSWLEEDCPMCKNNMPITDPKK